MLALGTLVTLASYTGPPIYSYVQILTSFTLSLSDPFGDDDDPVVVPLGDYLLEAIAALVALIFLFLAYKLGCCSCARAKKDEKDDDDDDDDNDGAPGGENA